MVRSQVAVVLAAAAAVATLPGALGLRMAALSPGATITIYGSGNKNVQLLAGKLACKAGFKANVLVDEGELGAARVLSYGKFYASGGVDAKGNTQFAVGADGLGKALKDSEGLIIVGEQGKGVEEKLIQSVISGTPGLKRITLLSEHGASKGGPMKATEASLKEAAAKAGVEWCVARCGLLKGGGPGNTERGDDYGLDRYFYDTNPEINSWQRDKFSDQYIGGASITKGDVVDVGPFQKIMAANSMSQATVGCTNRVSIASALVQSLRQEVCGNMDFGVDSIRGLAPPTQRSWDAAFAEMASTGAARTLYEPGEQPEVGRRSAADKLRQETMEKRGVADIAAPSGETRYKLGASTREEELERKQLIGHVIPFVFAAGAVFQGQNVFNTLTF